jgi:hypothetical protein
VTPTVLMKIHIHEGVCSGHGRGYTLGSSIIRADDEGFPNQLGRDEEAGPRVVANCPEGAIRVVVE